MEKKNLQLKGKSSEKLKPELKIKVFWNILVGKEKKKFPVVGENLLEWICQNVYLRISKLPFQKTI